MMAERVGQQEENPAKSRRKGDKEEDEESDEDMVGFGTAAAGTPTQAQLDLERGERDRVRPGAAENHPGRARPGGRARALSGMLSTVSSALAWFFARRAAGSWIAGDLTATHLAVPTPRSVKLDKYMGHSNSFR